MLYMVQKIKTYKKIISRLIENESLPEIILNYARKNVEPYGKSKITRYSE